MRQQSSSRRVGRHRRTNPPLPSSSLISLTVLCAAMAAGIGSVAASASPIGSARDSRPNLPTAAHAPATLPIVPPAGDEAPGKWYPRLDPIPENAGANRPVAARVRLRARPLPAAPRSRAARSPAAQWVHPNPTAQMTSCFGQRWGRLHAGIDLAAPPGTPIRAAGAGVVVSAGPNGGYGNAILIDHRDGWLTHYGHLAVITVQIGQRVSAGQVIGAEGSTGHSTGPHLHFEVHQGHFQNPVEPTAWMRAHGVPIPGCAIAAPTASRSGHDGGSTTSSDRRSRSGPASPAPAPPPPAPGPDRSADGSPDHRDPPSAPVSSRSRS
ncbi:Murein DD-endopeptidase MepM and murein hydrolase activator NlpD, contain LysM domain [Actinoplanes derwentensis]|uniref:Murein DD-endopeptidase MepM and murein hydrolase activator NlpD, contain LysM domain n=1 Tax=Actinoplanes derwentensis TaxID=113562 RepID=A0A1H2CK11_9ACTN|nr:Murein DD-endopeptidase MepM and murein hydrolase activator NlpD, contain LysM domain [Actinoplanes derwentensis]